MHPPFRSTFWALSCLSFACLISQEIISEEINIYRCRTEGRITSTYVQGDETVVQELAFTESIDSIAAKSAISIGYVSHNQEKFYKFGDNPIVTIHSDGKCVSLKPDIMLAPTISWLIHLMLPGVDLKEYKKPEETMNLVGPTGLVQIFARMIKSKGLVDVKIDATAKVTHRNILCDVFSQTFRLPDKNFSITLEILTPVNGIVFRSMEDTYFTVKVKTTYEDAKATVSSAGFVIDFFNIEQIDDQTKLENFNQDFNIPLGFGCSEFLKQIEPEVKSYSFSMSYAQQSTLTPMLLAYDHSTNLFRKEHVGLSVSIWDLSEDMLYHIDKNVSRLVGNQEIKHERTPCAVMEVVDPKLGPAYHPYEKYGESLTVLNLIGAQQVAYMGIGSVRDLPCYIYETILKSPPIIFGLTEEQLLRNSAAERDYIVQYYLLKGNAAKPNTELNDEAFFPAKIVLLRRIKSTGVVEFIDQLDIYEFYWSLDGWDKKGVELFMASECFYDEAQHLRLELAIVFDKVHDDMASEQDKTLLAYNKFKLESDLVNNVLELLSVRQTHLVRYELKLRPNHVNLNMVLADRTESKNLRYFGTGTLANADSYSNNRIILAGLSEESCISVSSLMVDISLVVYCPYQQLDIRSSCTAVYGENEPAVKSFVNPDGLDCQVYRYSYGTSPRKATHSVMTNKFQLYEHQFDFVATLPWVKGGAIEILKGTIKDYEISHDFQLLTVDNYAFVIENDNDRDVRSFDSISFNNIGDCIRVCNLDVTCRSYSFCSSKDDGSSTNQCHLSTLDIRGANIQQQLVYAPQSESQSQNGSETIGFWDKKVTVAGDRGKKYRLQFRDQCDIYERDYLSMFRQTDEIIRLPRSMIHQFQTAPSTFDCAKQSVDLEQDFDHHHVAMFAYCGSENLCILDESLFATTTNNISTGEIKSPADDIQQDPDRETLCNVYRKKYQTYFEVSGHVLAQSSHQDRQVEFKFNTVEECARACWNQFGQVCSSFDFCSPGSCFINQLSANSAGVQLETKSGCLHYERNLKWDELRKKHLIGRHSILEAQTDATSTWASFFWNLLTVILVTGSFAYGLLIGRRVNDKLESVTVLTQSISYGRGPRGSRFFGEARPIDDDNSDAPGDSVLNASDEVSSNTNAIRMEVIKSD